MNQNTPAGASAPWHLWLIGIVLVIFNGMAAIDYLATVFRYDPYLSAYSEEILAYYFSAPLWMYAMWGIGAFGGLASAILLLMRNKLAVPLVAAAWVCSIVAVIYSIVNPGPEGMPSPVFSVIVILVTGLIVLYFIAMKRRGVLR